MTYEPWNLRGGPWHDAPLYRREGLFFVGVASSHDIIAARCRFPPKKQNRQATQPA